MIKMLLSIIDEAEKLLLFQDNRELLMNEIKTELSEIENMIDNTISKTKTSEK